MSPHKSEPDENLNFDQRAGKNIMKFRGNMSQQALAERMRDKGFKWSQATVWATEKGERPVRLSEVIALSEVLEKPYDAFFLDEHDTNNTLRITESVQLLLRERTSIRRALKRWISVKYGVAAIADVYGPSIDHNLPKRTQQMLKAELQDIDFIAQQESINDIYKEAEADFEAESEKAFDEDDNSDDDFN